MSLARLPPRPVQPAGAGRPGRAETAAKVLYRELKAEIVSMRRKPGAPIIEREIASSYGVSRTPVREAVLRLADEALVDIFPQSGTFVARIPLALLPEAILVREADEAFHAMIAESAGHPGIWMLIQQVKIQVDRYRRLTLPVPGRMARVLQEHTAIVKAIEARDPESAAAAMAAHLDGLSASIADVRDLNPEYFVEDLRPPAPDGS